MADRFRRITAMIALFSVLGMLIVACGGNTTGGEGGAAATAGAGAGAAATTDAGAGAGAAATTDAGAGAAATMAPTDEPASAQTTTANETATATGAGTAGTTTAAGTAGTTTAAGGGAAPAMTLPADCTNVELAYWNPFTGPDQPFMQQLVDSFNQEQGGNINVTMTAQAEYNTQLATAAASGQLPDVAIINEDRVATEAFNGVIRPIDDIVQQMGFSAADFPEVAWNSGNVAGQQYGVPLSFVAMTMYYNNDLLTAAGLTAPPTNREEFEAAAQAMTQGNNKGFMVTSGFPVQQIFQQLLHQFGGTEFSEDGSQATWNSEAGVQALQWLKDAQTNYSEPGLEVDAELNAYKSGTAGMIWNGSWQIPNLTGEAVEFAGQIAPVPQIGDQPAVWAGGPYLTLPARAGEPDPCKDAAAAMFIRYVVDNSAVWAQGGNVPAYNQARQDPAFTALPQAALAESVENPVFPPAIPGVGDAFAPLGEAVGAVMTGAQTDIQAALDESASRANQILAENQQRYGDAPRPAQ